jgi:UDPglucose 6-dehydrogenase
MSVRIGIVGAGYVGLVSGVCFASLGHRVVIRDINASKIDALNAGQVPIHEPGLDDLIDAHRERLTFTMNLSELVASCEVIFVTVDTPPTYSGDADLSRVMTVIDEIAAIGGQPTHLMVMKSTVPVGTGARVRRHLDAAGLGGIRYVSNPEFLREGSAISDFLRPDRVVIGAAPADAAPVAALYSGIDAPVMTTSVATAEMIKYASNAFLATKISFINEIANVCEETGADVAVVADGMGLDRRIGASFLRAGIGYGGSCFPKDVSALKQLAGNSGYHFQLLTSVIEVNELQKRRVVGKLRKHLGDLRGSRIALLGLTFKPGTDDMREAASLVLAGRLVAEGAHVVGWDPVVVDPDGLLGIELVRDPVAALAGAAACVVVTEWPEVLGLDWSTLRRIMAHPVVIDGRNALDPVAMERSGFIYEGIGRIPSAVAGAGGRN